MAISQCSSYFDSTAPKIVLESLFSKYDKDMNGKLDRKELYMLLKDDLGMTDEQAEIYRHLLDRNGDGLISYKEFEKWFHSGEKFQTIKDETRYNYLQKAVEMFIRYDTDNNCSIDHKEFHKLFKELGGKGKKKEKQALSDIDIDKNGRVSFQEFLKWLNWIPLDHLILNYED